VTYDRGAPGDGTFQIDLTGSNLSFSIGRGNCGTGECGNDTGYTSDCATAGSDGLCSTGNGGTFNVCVHRSASQEGLCSSYNLTFSWSP
jgi:hypothetical protein